MKKPAVVLTTLALVASGCTVPYRQSLITLPTPPGVSFEPRLNPPRKCNFSSLQEERDLWDLRQELKKDLRRREELRQKLKKDLRRELEKGLKVGISQSTPRMSFRNPYTGEFEGFEIDMVMKIAEAIFGSKNARDRVVFFVVPFAEGIKRLNEETVDVLAESMTITCARKEGAKDERGVAFSVGYLDTGQTMLVRTEPQYKSISGLYGKRVCSGEGTVSIERIRTLPGNMVPVTAPVTSDCLLMLKQRQVEAISSDESILLGLKDMNDTTKEMGDTTDLLGGSLPKRIEECGRNEKKHDCAWFASGSYGFAFRNTDGKWNRNGKWSRDEKLLIFADIVLGDIKRNKGGWQEIHDKWLLEHSDEGPPPDPRPEGHE